MKFQKEFSNGIKLSAIFKEDSIPENLIQKDYHVTEFLDQKQAFLFLGEKASFTTKSYPRLFKTLLSLSRDYELDLASFLVNDICAPCITNQLYDKYLYHSAKIYSAKTSKKEEINELTIVHSEINDIQEKLNITKTFSEAVNFARDLQNTPPNICNSEWLADKVVQELSLVSELKITVLDKSEIENKKMGLLLSVNRGSTFEPRLVVIEYNGNPQSKEKTVFVGKGITFDSGGYNIKTGRHMIGMKYDMSGSAIVAAAMKIIGKIKPKANVAAIMAITDNRVNGDANLPDAVWTSMNGKTVEINNTDAEGRLVLADGLTYAIRELKATELVSVATLTGAILVSLGTTFTGAFATSDSLWKGIKTAAEYRKELLWRLPLHDDFAKDIKKSKVADLRNTDYTGKGGSISAAMFLKEFVEDKPFVHLDIAGTADVFGDEPTGVMVKTLAQFIINKENN